MTMTTPTTKPACLSLFLAIALSSATSADVWDTATHPDNDTVIAVNELVHGSEQTHDLGDIVAGTTADEDWYAIVNAPYASYEAVVDGVTGDLAPNGSGAGILLDRRDPAGFLIQSATPVASGTVMHIAWDDGDVPSVGRLRVRDLGCPGCSTDDQYRIRFFDTTCSIPRFNNSATQITVMVLQNVVPNVVVQPAPTLTGHYWLLSTAGVVLNAANNSYSIPPGGTFVRNTAVDAAGGSGAILVTNDQGYGAVAGKAVALEPATGFTFDTALSCRPH